MNVVTKDYIYTRKDGGTTFCYGKLREDSNIYVTCDSEALDGVITDNSRRTWHGVCVYLEKSYSSQIEELSAV